MNEGKRVREKDKLTKEREEERNRGRKENEKRYVKKSVIE